MSQLGIIVLVGTYIGSYIGNTRGIDISDINFVYFDAEPPERPAASPTPRTSACVVSLSACPCALCRGVGRADSLRLRVRRFERDDVRLRLRRRRRR